MEDEEIEWVALLLVRRHGTAAKTEAAERRRRAASAEGRAAWRRIADAVEELLAAARPH